MPILATYDPNGSIKITASAINQDLGNSFSKYIVEQKDPRFVYAIARAVTADVPNKNWDFFPLEEIQRAYPSFIGRNIFLDHNTTSVRNAVGKIIAAELREDEEGHTYVACLFKVDRQIHPDIAMKIENGIIDSVSMGANVMQAECSICHHRATREAEFCEHLHNLGRYQDFEHGTQNYSINHGVEFTELSLVSVPADPTAKMHKVFEAHSDLKKKADDTSTDLNADVAQPAQPAQDDPNVVYSVDVPEVMKNGRTDADVPANKSTLVEPVNKDTGFFQIDAASTEAADLLYNILDAYTNKGIEELLLQGRTIKMLFSPDVKDAYKFIGDCVAVFGMELGHGVVLPEKVQASYNTYLTVAGKDKHLNNYRIVSEFDSPYLGHVVVRKRDPRNDTVSKSNIAQIIFEFDNDQVDVDAVGQFLTNYTGAVEPAVNSTPMDPSKAVSFVVRVELPDQVEGTTASQYRNLKDAFVNDLVSQIAPKLQDITSIQTANETIKKNEQVMLSDREKAWIDNKAWGKLRKGEKMTDESATDLCNLVYSRFSDSSKGGNPQKCLNALLYLNSVPELLNSKQHDLVLNFYKDKTKEAVKNPKTQDNTPIEQVQQAVNEVKVDLPKEQATDVINEVKEQAPSPIVKDVIEQAEEGKVTISMDTLVEDYGQAVAGEMEEEFKYAAQSLKQKADAAGPLEEEEEDKQSNVPVDQPSAPEQKQEPAPVQEPVFDNKTLTQQDIDLVKHYLSDPKNRDKSLVSRNSKLLPLFNEMREKGYKPGEINTDELFNKLFPKNLPYALAVKQAYTKWYMYADSEAKKQQQPSTKEEAPKTYSHKLLQDFAAWVDAYKKDPNGETVSAIDSGSVFGKMAGQHFTTKEEFDKFLTDNTEAVQSILGNVPAGFFEQFLSVARDNFEPVANQAEQEEGKQEQPASDTVEQAVENNQSTESGRGFTRELPAGAKIEEDDQDKTEASQYMDSLGSFVYGKWQFTLKEANDLELKPEIVYVKRVRRIRKNRYDKATVEMPTPEKIADNQNYEIGYVPKLMYPAVTRKEVRKIYRIVPAMMAIMLNTPIDGEVSVTYHVDCKDPIYVGVENAEEGKQFDITFTRQPGEQGNYTYVVRGLDKEISGKANSFKDCMAGILNQMYQGRAGGHPTDDESLKGLVSFAFTPLKYDMKTLMSKKDDATMAPITGEVTLVIDFDGEKYEKPIAQYSIEKLLPGDQSENMKVAVYTSAFIHLIAADDDQQEEENNTSDTATDKEQTKDVPAGEPKPEQPASEHPVDEKPADPLPFKQVDQDADRESKQYANMGRNPQYVFTITPLTTGTIDGASYVNAVHKLIEYSEIEDFLTSSNPDSFRGVLMEWEANISKYVYTKLYDYVMKNKQQAQKGEQPQAEKPAAATPSASRGFTFYVRG